MSITDDQADSILQAIDEGYCVMKNESGQVIGFNYFEIEVSGRKSSLCPFIQRLHKSPQSKPLPSNADLFKDFFKDTTIIDGSEFLSQEQTNSSSDEESLKHN